MPHHVKQAAYEIDPECWMSYNDKPRDFKRAMNARRLATLEKAAESTSASRTEFSPS